MMRKREHSKSTLDQSNARNVGMNGILESNLMEPSQFQHHAQFLDVEIDYGGEREKTLTKTPSTTLPSIFIIHTLTSNIG